jgi:DNA repair exonuclease SbcCD ATPase subunit
MLKILSLRIEAFRSVEDVQFVDGLPLSGLIGVDGFNQVTGGSSGAGKSTFVNAIAFVTGISPFPLTKQQNLYTEAAATVEMRCQDDAGRIITIHRGRDSLVNIDGKTHVMGATKVEEYVRNLFGGINKKMMQALTHRRQRERGMFVSMDASERQAFLAKVIGLDEVERLMATLKDTKKVQVDKQAEKQRWLDMVRMNVPSEPQAPGQVFVMTVAGDKIPVEEFDQWLIELEAKKAVIDAGRQGKIQELRDEVSKVEAKFMERKTELMGKRATLDAQIEALSVRKIDPETEAAVQALKDEIDGINANVLEAMDRKAKALEEGREAVGKRTDVLQKTKIKASQLFNLRKTLTVTQDQIRSTQSNLAKLQASECPTCDREWHDPKCLQAIKDAEDRLRMLEEAEKETNKNIEQAEWHQASVAEIEEGIAAEEVMTKKREERFNSLIADLKAKIVALQAKIKAMVDEALKREPPQLQPLREQRKAVDKEITDEHGVFRDEMDELASALKKFEDSQRDLDDKMKTLKMNGVMAKDTHKKGLASYEEKKVAYEQALAKVKKAEAEVREAEKAVALTEDSLVATRGYLNAVTEELLNDIAIEANGLLRNLKNVGTTTVRFRVEESFRAGLPVYSIAIIAERDGREFDFDANLSGGQQASTELAIDLAIVTALSKRQGGKVPGWMMIDEAFEGHEPITKEGCLAVLQAFAQDRQVFVIDHASEFKEYYACKVLAKYDGRKTEFEVLK